MQTSCTRYSLQKSTFIFCPARRPSDKHVAVYTMRSDLGVWGGAGPGQQHRAAGPGAGVHEVGASLPLSDQRRHPQRPQLHGADGDRAGEPEEKVAGSGSVRHFGPEHGVLGAPGPALGRSGGGPGGLGRAAPPAGQRHRPRASRNSSLQLRLISCVFPSKTIDSALNPGLDQQFNLSLLLFIKKKIHAAKE